MKRNLLKKKALHVAVATALAGGMGMVQTASAVHWNPDGTGEVLIYPYWTVNGGYDTLISIVNTTGKVKAVKVRFLEYKNSWEVLDFNLYLSPFDVWVAAVSDFDNDGIAEIKTPDISCTVPAIPPGGQEFLPFAIQQGEPPGSTATNDRLREGHLEVIEMGEVKDDPNTNFKPATWATHGPNMDCQKLADAFNGQWSNPNDPATVTEPKGGLFGNASIINVGEGTDFGYEAIALDAWSTVPRHAKPGTVFPQLGQVLPARSTVFADVDNDGTPEAVTSNWPVARAIDAVSAVFMHTAIMNEYVLDAATQSGTDWVVTFPTKRFYTPVFNTAAGNPPQATQPFTQPFRYDGDNGTTEGACENVTLEIWDREENKSVTEGFSPPPPQGDKLCWETNVITFNNSDVLHSALPLNVSTPFENGWMKLNFTNPNNVMLDQQGLAYRGLPAVGFMVQTFFNGNVNGLLSNYGGLFDHRYKRIISSGS